MMSGRSLYACTNWHKQSEQDRAREIFSPFWAPWQMIWAELLAQFCTPHHSILAQGPLVSFLACFSFAIVGRLGFQKNALCMATTGLAGL